MKTKPNKTKNSSLSKFWPHLSFLPTISIHLKKRCCCTLRRKKIKMLRYTEGCYIKDKTQNKSRQKH